MFNKRILKLTIFCLFALSFIAVSIYHTFFSSDNLVNTEVPSATDTPDSLVYGPYTVVRVIDGDTIDILLDNEEIRVRLLGIDCPESVSPDESKNTIEGKYASIYTDSVLLSKDVYLEYDKEKYDQYNRLLAYVYYYDLNGNLIMFNRELLQNGYAKPLRIEPNSKYFEEFSEIYSSLE